MLIQKIILHIYRTRRYIVAQKKSYVHTDFKKLERTSEQK